MKADELIKSLFVADNGLAPKDVIASDNFAMGCWLITKGKKEAGIKMLSNAITLIGCMNAEKGKQIRKYAIKNPAEAFKIVRAHAEILNLLQT